MKKKLFTLMVLSILFLFSFHVSPQAQTQNQQNEKQLVVTASVLNFRSSPKITNNIIGKLLYNQTVIFLNKEGNWSLVKAPNGKTGYVYNTYVKEKTASTTNKTDIRNQVVAYAKQFLGNPYVYGGNSLTNGVDCSGFTQQILKKFGYSINRTSKTQILNGTRVNANELLPGDLVFYGYSGVISHVAMYIGDGKIIHANSSKTGIITSNLYYGSKPYIGSTRII